MGSGGWEQIKVQVKKKRRATKEKETEQQINGGRKGERQK
jgi:hypothetical protein